MLGPLMIGLGGLTLTAEEKRQLQHPLVGGVILFSRNYQDSQQLRELTASIHAAGQRPLLIAVDQEGGRVQRFRDGFTRLPASGVCGNLYDKNRQAGLSLAKTCGELMASELLAHGVDLSFAPVLDIDNGSRVIGDRAFHQAPTAAIALSQAYIEGMKAAGMAAVGKHFPGHGSVEIDTHLNTAVDERSWADIVKLDLLPFVAAIKAGLPAMMIAHVIYTAIDKVPAGFSVKCLQDILRAELKFHGAIFSDDMGMMAAKHFGDPITGIQAALSAGCDMVLLCNEPEVTKLALDTLSIQPSLEREQRLQKLVPKSHVSAQRMAELKQDLTRILSG